MTKTSLIALTALTLATTLTALSASPAALAAPRDRAGAFPQPPAGCLGVGQDASVTDDGTGVRFIVKVENTCFPDVDMDATVRLISDSEVLMSAPLDAEDRASFDRTFPREPDASFHEVCVEIVGTATTRYRGRDYTEPVAYKDCQVVKY